MNITATDEWQLEGSSKNSVASLRCLAACFHVAGICILIPCLVTAFNSLIIKVFCWSRKFIKSVPISRNLPEECSSFTHYKCIVVLGMRSFQEACA
ncbi:hypothetical protein PanWU01x14_199950 [Parasponia andersonii]|uniref:Uncharacterized protein n=1 Tax=Parasponia andersonii TaxID=3476 RepID=A0A2P5BYE8_PARAD|nr:hypothetical protein PanWU01x14_199950 [Parasponia andersonii]